MARFRRDRECRLGLVVLCLALGLSQGCARSEPLQPAGSSSTASGQKPPFRPDADRAPSDSAHPAVPPDPQLASALPFRADSQPRTLPSGTLVTVELESSLSTGKVHAGDPFTASVAAPLTIDGETLIKLGTAVTGSVEAMQLLAARPGVAPASGYFRLNLSALTVDGRQIALQTSSLFARGTAQKFDAASRSGVRVPKGRRLIFRLTAPVTLGGSNSIANRQYLSPTTE